MTTIIHTFTKPFNYAIENTSIYFSNSAKYFMKITLTDFILPLNELITLLIMTVCWICLYIVVHNIPFKYYKQCSVLKNLDTKNRIVSIIHASILCLLAIYDYLFYQSTKCGISNTKFQNDLLIFSCSYFIYDILISLYFNILEPGMLLHHVFVILSEYSGILFNNSASEMLRAIIVGEISNPIMHFRKIVSNFNLKDTKLFLFLEYSYFFLYILFRMTFGWYVLYWTICCMDNLFIVKLGGTIILVQSALFTVNMYTIIKRRVKEQKERNKERVSLFWFEFNKNIASLNYYKKTSLKDSYVP